VSSSRRFKEDIHDMADASRRLLKLRSVTFRYTQAFGDGTRPVKFGLIVEEVAETFTELAVRNARGEVETVHYETLNVLLLNELQRMHTEMGEQSACERSSGSSTNWRRHEQRTSRRRADHRQHSAHCLQSFQI